MAVAVAPVRNDRLAEALRMLSSGGAALLVDDCSEGCRPTVAMVAGAATIDANTVGSFMRLGGGGTIAVVAPEARWSALGLRRGATVAARTAASGGVSASDRALTCRVLASAASRPTDLLRPGQVLVEAAAEGGLLFREGLEEAAIDLIRLAGRGEAAVIVFPVDQGGEPVDPAHLGGELGLLPSVTLDDLLLVRLASERIVDHVVDTTIPTRYGVFTAHGYRSRIDHAEHVALTMGEIDAGPTLTRVHQACPAGDIFRAGCGCRQKLEASLRLISEMGRGVVVYLTHDSDVHHLRHPGRPMDVREIGLGAQMLLDLGIREMELLTTSDRAFPHLATYGLTITTRVAPVYPSHSERWAT
jgi:3,4-dihydroxy 2-butanone 4-phosphate synthase/GTP cyclohydrolase II